MCYKLGQEQRLLTAAGSRYLIGGKSIEPIGQESQEDHSATRPATAPEPTDYEQYVLPPPTPPLGRPIESVIVVDDPAMNSEPWRMALKEGRLVPVERPDDLYRQKVAKAVGIIVEQFGTAPSVAERDAWAQRDLDAAKKAQEKEQLEEPKDK